jgi:elongation factor Tu
MDKHFDLPQRDVTSPLILPIDNILTVPGRGTVVIGKSRDLILMRKTHFRIELISLGTVKRGTVRKNDSLEVCGFGFRSKTSVSGIQIFKNNVQSASAGDNIGLNLRGIKAEVLQKGMLVITPASLTPTNHFEGTCYFLTKSEGGRTRPIMNKYIQVKTQIAF